MQHGFPVCTRSATGRRRLIGDESIQIELVAADLRRARRGGKYLCAPRKMSAAGLCLLRDPRLSRTVTTSGNNN